MVADVARIRVPSLSQASGAKIEIERSSRGESRSALGKVQAFAGWIQRETTPLICGVFFEGKPRGEL